jgi:hypothetical protein
MREPAWSYAHAHGANRSVGPFGGWDPPAHAFATLAPVDDLGPALLDLLGGRGCVELLADVETDPDGLDRLRLIAALREVLGEG